MNKPASIIICGGASVAFGGFYLLESLGVLPGLPRDANRPLIGCAGVTFLLGGLAVILTLAPGAFARAAITWMTLGIVICMASIAAWVTFDAAPGSISGPLAFISPKLNDAVGRIAFGFGALILVGIAVAILRSLLRAKPAAGDGD